MRAVHGLFVKSVQCPLNSGFYNSNWPNNLFYCPRPLNRGVRLIEVSLYTGIFYHFQQWLNAGLGLQKEAVISRL